MFEVIIATSGVWLIVVVLTCGIWNTVRDKDVELEKAHTQEMKDTAVALGYAYWDYDEKGLRGKSFTWHNPLTILKVEEN